MRAAEIARSHSDLEASTDEHHALRVHGPQAAIGALSIALGRAGVAILSLTPELASLEDLFFRLTEGAEDAGPHPATPLAASAIEEPSIGDASLGSPQAPGAGASAQSSAGARG